MQIKVLKSKNNLFPNWSIEKLADIAPINIQTLLLIFDPIAKEHIPKNVSPAPTVSSLF